MSHLYVAFLALPIGKSAVYQSAVIRKQIEARFKDPVCFIGRYPIHSRRRLTTAANVIYVAAYSNKSRRIRLTVSHIAHISLPHRKRIVYKNAVFAERIRALSQKSVRLICGNGADAFSERAVRTDIYYLSFRVQDKTRKARLTFSYIAKSILPNAELFVCHGTVFLEKIISFGKKSVSFCRRYVNNVFLRFIGSGEIIVFAVYELKSRL